MRLDAEIERHAEAGPMVSPDPASARARRYLLGDLTEDERVAIEQEFFGDAAAVDRIEAAEDDLIEAYLANRLDAGTRQRFEDSYLAAPHHRTRVETMRHLLAQAEAQAAASPTGATRVTTAASDHGTPIAAIGGQANGVRPAMAVAPMRAAGEKIASVTPAAAARRAGVSWQRGLLLAAAVLLIAAISAWIVLRERSSATSTTQRGDGGETPAAASQHPLQTQPPTIQPRVFAWSLAPGGVRSAAQTPFLIIPADTDTVALTLEGDAHDPRLRQPRVVIRTIPGDAVWQGAATAATAREPGVLARAEIPAGRLRAEDFIVLLFDTDAAGIEHERLRYALRVRTAGRALPR
jgi:hypothetical protein